MSLVIDLIGQLNYHVIGFLEEVVGSTVEYSRVSRW